MLVIGHRGAAGLAHENTIKALQAGYDNGADILEFDVQVTRDGELLVVHDTTLFRTHKKATIIRWSSHESIKHATEKGHQIATLKEVLDQFYGRILLNLEIKNRNTGRVITEFLRDNYIKQPEDWQNILISSFKASELIAARKVSEHAELALLHHRNPFAFIAYQRSIGFSAVGFHRLHLNPLALEIAGRIGLFRYVYTVNRADSINQLEKRGIEGIVTDNPAYMLSELARMK